VSARQPSTTVFAVRVNTSNSPTPTDVKPGKPDVRGRPFRRTHCLQRFFARGEEFRLKAFVSADRMLGVGSQCACPSPVEPIWHNLTGANMTRCCLPTIPKSRSARKKRTVCWRLRQVVLRVEASPGTGRSNSKPPSRLFQARSSHSKVSSASLRIPCACAIW